MESFFLNSEGENLYVTYHPPTAQQIDRNIGVIICPSIGQEHIRTYKTLLILAQQLSKNSFHTIRFDYSGCGDSFGDFDKANVDIWSMNLRQVIEEFEKALSLQKVILVGLRIGAHIINNLLDAELGGKYEQIWWHPLSSGSAFISEMQSTHKQWLQRSFVLPQSCSKQEFLGFDYSEQLLTSISQIRSGKQKYPVALCVGDRKGPYEAFLSSREYGFWLHENPDGNKGMVPVNDIHQIVNWIRVKYG